MTIISASRLCHSFGNTTLMQNLSKGFASYVRDKDVLNDSKPNQLLLSKVSEIVKEHFSANVIRDPSFCKKSLCHCKQDYSLAMHDPFLCQQDLDIDALCKDLLSSLPRIKN
jgi:hypothetical protein